MKDEIVVWEAGEGGGERRAGSCMAREGGRMNSMAGRMPKFEGMISGN